jgi:hypothetical protein
MRAGMTVQVAGAIKLRRVWLGSLLPQCYGFPDKNLPRKDTAP